MIDYGKANRYNFDDPNKWVTVESVPLLDEHEMTDESGNPVAYVDKGALQEIANNNNRKVYETGDPATLILGHTSDDPRAPEKPAQGFVINYKVKPFKRNKDGQLVYAIHGDYKVRPNKAHLIEEYPRRSVELWWHKKDIDPIAMLGGSSPERDLGVLLRHSRNAVQLSHVSMDASGVGGSGSRSTGSEMNTYGEEVIRFSTHGHYSIETYYISDNTPTHKYAKRRKAKVEKVMKEYKDKELHSGSKKGPKVTSHKQAVAIAMNEAGMNNKNGKHNKSKYNRPTKYGMNGSTGMGSIGGKKMAPKESDYGVDDEGVDANNEGSEQHEPDDDGYGAGPLRYDNEDMETGNEGEDYDGGEESIPNEGEDSDENNPVLAEVFQSKQWNQMSSDINDIKQMLSGLMGAEEQDQSMDNGMGEEGGMNNEMPPPNTAAPSQGMPPGEAEEPGMEEEDQRSMHGQKPVKMGMSTGMPGPSNTFIPNQVGKKSPSKMSRSNPSMNGQQSKREDKRDRVIRDLRIQLSRMKAQADIDQLEKEGVLFGPTPEVSDKIKFQRTEELTMAYLWDEDSVDNNDEPDTYVKDKIEEMRLCYSRRKPSPVRNTQNQASVARYARTEVDVLGQPTPNDNSDDDFEDKLGAVGSFEAINEFASLQASGKMDKQAAIKFCRKKYGIR